MAKIRHALVTLTQSITITLKGQYEWKGHWEEVIYQRIVKLGSLPVDIAGALQDIYAKIKEVAMMAGATALPISVQGLEIPRYHIEIEVHKRGEGIHVVYSRADQKGLAVGNFHARTMAQFPEALSVSLGIKEGEKNWDITRPLEEITASLFGDQYGPSWNV
jgi:hypothetical protein